MTDDTLERVREHYTRHPYPPPMDLVDAIRAGRMSPGGSPDAHFRLFWPAQEPRGDLDILVAGCGTQEAVLFGLANPQARIHAIDISPASLEASTDLARAHGVDNITHHNLAIEQTTQIDQAG